MGLTKKALHSCEDDTSSCPGPYPTACPELLASLDSFQTTLVFHYKEVIVILQTITLKISLLEFIVFLFAFYSILIFRVKI